MHRTRNLLIGLVALVAIVASASIASAEEAPAKNVVLMISDGIGFNGWEAAKYDQGSLPYDNDNFTFYGMTTYMNNVYDNAAQKMLNSDSDVLGEGVKGIDAATQNWTAVPQGYDANAMWTDFEYHRNNESYNGFTDSAAAATAMYTGTKTYNSAVSIDVNGAPLKTIAEYAAEMGKATAAVSSVQFSHATPAAVDAHTFYRYNKTAIAGQQIASDLDVIMGGDAYVDTEGEYPGAVAGFKADAIANGYTVIDQNDMSDWDTLADSSVTPPSKVLGTFDGSTLGGRAKPTLELMTQGALNVLDENENGFFMMVEGGAVDWANHDNALSSMLHEQRDFDNSVQAVIDWVEQNSNWDETLLIVTSDHETGCIWGPGSGIVDVNGTPADPSDDQHVFNNVLPDQDGDGLPEAIYLSGGHTNALVPMWARGPGAEMFDELVDGADATAAGFWTQFGGAAGWNGEYIDNTDIFTVMHGASVPEPTTMILLGLGAVAAIRRRRS